MEISSVEGLREFFTNANKTKNTLGKSLRIINDPDFDILLEDGDTQLLIDYADTRLCMWHEMIEVLKFIEPSIIQNDQVCLNSESNFYSAYAFTTYNNNFYYFEDDAHMEIKFKETGLNNLVLFDYDDKARISAIVFSKLDDQFGTWAISVIQRKSDSKYLKSLDVLMRLDD